MNPSMAVLLTGSSIANEEMHNWGFSFLWNTRHALGLLLDTGLDKLFC